MLSQWQHTVFESTAKLSTLLLEQNFLKLKIEYPVEFYIQKQPPELVRKKVDLKRCF